MRLIAIAAMIFASMASPAMATFKSGNDLQESCLNRHELDSHKAILLGYFMGYADSSEFSKSSNKEKQPQYCMPSNVTAGQGVDVACRFLKENPDKRHYSAASLLYYALKEAFPCK